MPRKPAPDTKTPYNPAVKPAVITAISAVVVALIGGMVMLMSRPPAPDAMPAPPQTSTSSGASAPLDLVSVAARLASKGAGERQSALLEISDAAATLPPAQRQPVTNLLVRFIRIRAAEFTGIAQPRRDTRERAADPRPAPDDLRMAFEITQRVRSLGNTTVSLKRLPLVGMEFKGVDFSGFDLTDSDFFGASFDEAKFEAANLTRVWLRGGFCWQANFNAAVMTDANLTGVGFSDAQFVGAKLAGANLSGADLKGASIADADLTDATLTNTNLEVRDYRGAVFGSPVHCDTYTKFPADFPRPTCVPPT